MTNASTNLTFQQCLPVTMEGRIIRCINSSDDCNAENYSGLIQPLEKNSTTNGGINDFATTNANNASSNGWCQLSIWKLKVKNLLKFLKKHFSFKRAWRRQQPALHRSRIFDDTLQLSFVWLDRQERSAGSRRSGEVSTDQVSGHPLSWCCLKQIPFGRNGCVHEEVPLCQS